MVCKASVCSAMHAEQNWIGETRCADCWQVTSAKFSKQKWRAILINIDQRNNTSIRFNSVSYKCHGPLPHIPPIVYFIPKGYFIPDVSVLDSQAVAQRHSRGQGCLTVVCLVYCSGDSSSLCHTLSHCVAITLTTHSLGTHDTLPYSPSACSQLPVTTGIWEKQLLEWKFC